MFAKLFQFGVNIDWQALAGFAGAGAIVWAAFTAKKTIKDFRQTHSAELEATTAQSILEETYKSEQALSAIRHAQHAELVSAYDHFVESEGVHAAELRKIAYYEKLLSENNDPFVRLISLLPRARAVFGDEVAKCIIVIENCNTRLSAALNQLRSFHELGRDIYGPQNVHPGIELGEQTKISLETCNSKYWPILQPDELDNSKMQLQFDQAKKRLEDILLPIIRSNVRQ